MRRTGLALPALLACALGCAATAALGQASHDAQKKEGDAPMPIAPAPTTGSMPKGGPTPSGKLGTEPTSKGRLGTDPNPAEQKSKPPRPQ
jgi:hypothetical protein